ncbi:PAS domain-containing protein [Rhodobacter sp. CZR27]|uniref:PAS domain-containing protein n=1 Tax=Rhodobacter sp. CZR27 TaxID=2033869 RepID=UPI000BBF3971|nr:PAS domain-containing protein [Rhodobacter sp. CZR27]
MGIGMGHPGGGHPGGGRPGVGPAALAQIRSYWHALRRQGGQTLPRRSDIDPRAIEDALTCAFLAERIAPGMARFRLAGMHLADLMGVDVRGMPVSALFDLDSRPRLSLVLNQVFTVPGIGELWLEAPKGLGRPALTGRMMLLPLRGEDDVPLTFGCLITDGPLGRAPRRLAISRAVVETLDMVPAERPAAHRIRLPEFAEAQTPFVPPPRAEPGRAHLRLVKSDRPHA